MNGTVLLVAGGLIWFACYLVACAIWPYGNCRKCGGGGRIRSPSGKAWRRCGKCKHTGARLRVGTRIYNYFRRDQ